MKNKINKLYNYITEAKDGKYGFWPAIASIFLGGVTIFSVGGILVLLLFLLMVGPILVGIPLIYVVYLVVPLVYLNYKAGVNDNEKNI